MLTEAEFQNKKAQLLSRLKIKRLRMERVGGLLILTLVVCLLVAVAAQAIGLLAALRQHDWLKALLLATPFGHLYLLNLALNSHIFGRPPRGWLWHFYGFAIRPNDPLHMRLFKAAYNVGGGCAGALLLFGLLRASFTGLLSVATELLR